MGTVKYHMNDVIEKHQNKPKDPVQTVRKKEVLIVLPFLDKQWAFREPGGGVLPSMGYIGMYRGTGMVFEILEP